jgi:hypothetical protein
MLIHIVTEARITRDKRHCDVRCRWRYNEWSRGEPTPYCTLFRRPASRKLYESGQRRWVPLVADNSGRLLRCRKCLKGGKEAK